MSDHRHFPPGIPEHDYEPELGLPEKLPEQEKILWQGSPNWKQVAVRIVHIRAIVVYFILLLAFQAYGVWEETGSSIAVGFALLKSSPFVACALAGFTYLAWAIANNAVYSITSNRIVMRIGIALTITYNIPFSRISAADLLKRTDGSGDISVCLQSGDKIAWINLWPHVRPWKIVRPEPQLKCLDNVSEVSQILVAAWTAYRGANAAQKNIVSGTQSAETTTHETLNFPGRSLGESA